jgi:hypothetical protein
MHGMWGLTSVTCHRALSAGTLLIAAGGLALYQMTSLVLGPGGSRELHLSITVPGVDADERTESWTPTITLALGTLAGPAPATSTRVRSTVAHGAAITLAGHPAVTTARPAAPQPPLTHPSAPPVQPIVPVSGPQPGAHPGDEPD